ncbi:hypothetical protein [Sphingosinicella sp. YJ22]|uniref:hypothetical protein n=1 Tax=Sphingosinicella sp. YJ22 TaxID=1104780 RepID=UPI0014076BC0|nr:hypothetical protein [Sphingosinicella sp. YJ22]
MPTRDDQDRRSSEPFDMMSALDMLGRRIGGALVLAGALIGVGIYWSGDTTEAPEYQGFAADGEVFRLNLDSGSIIACNAERCTQILRPGQDLEDNEGNTLFRVPPAAQLPAPAAQQPAAPAQPDQSAPKQVDSGQ